VKDSTDKAGAGKKREREPPACGKAADDQEAAEVVVRGAAATRNATDKHESAAALKRKAATDRKTADEQEATATQEHKAAADRKAADNQEAAAALEHKAAAERKAADDQEAATVLEQKAAADGKAAKAADEQKAAAALARKAAADRKAANDQEAAAALEHKAAADRKVAVEQEAAAALAREAAVDRKAAEEQRVAAALARKAAFDRKAADEQVAAAALALTAAAERQAAEEERAAAVHPQWSEADDAAAAKLSAAARKAGQTVWSGAPSGPPAVPDGSAWHPQAGCGTQSELSGSRYGACSDGTAAPSQPPPLHAAAGNDFRLDVLRDALPAGINGEIRQVGSFLISNLLTVIHLLYAKFNHELPDSAAPDATVVALVGVAKSSPSAVPGAASVKTALTVTPSLASQDATPPSTPAAPTLEGRGGGIAAARSPRKSVRQGSGAKKKAVVNNVYPNKQDPTWRRMMVAARRILMEEYDAEQDIWSDVDNIRPDVISETKKSISAESLRKMLSSFRWGGYGKPEDRVDDKLRQVAMGKPGVDNKEKARVSILRLWDVSWADPDWKDKEAKREVATTATGKRKPSVSVPWQLWLDELLVFVPELDEIRANTAGTAANRSNRRTDDVPAPSGVGADVGDMRGGDGRRGDGGGERGEQGVGENEQHGGVKDARRESGYLEGQGGGAGQEPGGGAGED